MLKKAGAIDDVNKIEVVLQNSQDKEIRIQLPTVNFFSMAPFFADTWYPQAGNGLVTMNQKAKDPLPLWLRNPGEKFWFKYIPEENVMFLQINSLNFPYGNENEESPFGKLCDQFFKAFDQSNADKLVIDIRRNTGGNHVELPLLQGILERPNIDKPDKLFLITSRVTFSAAVHLTTILKKYTNITIVGEPASGRPNHYGAKRAFRLPNHPQIEIHCSIDYYQDSEPFNFHIIHAPDIWVEMTATKYRNNIDPVMMAVTNYDQIINLVKKTELELRQLYTSNGIPGLKKAYYLNKQALLKSSYNLENFFTELYSGILSENKKSSKDLADYLAFAVSECPESIDLTYFLASQLESDGRLEEAKQKYSRCLELNPAHHYAKMKLGLIGLNEN